MREVTNPVADCGDLTAQESLSLSVVGLYQGDFRWPKTFDAEDLVVLAGCTLERVPGKQNWVDEVGGLPEYICRIAKSIHQKRGMPIGNAIAIAVDRVREWASGRGDVDADTRAKAAAAAAQWEAKKAKAKAKKG